MTMHPELEQWKAVVLPATTISTWTPSLARAGLAEVRRLRHQLDAAQACLVGVLTAETGRDTRATMRREFGMSTAEATRAAMVAEVIRRLPGAEAALACGRVSVEHLRHVHPVLDCDGVAQLLDALLWSGEAPDEFARRVERWRIEREGPSRRERQRAARGVRFSSSEDGGVIMRALLCRVDGERVRAVLNAVTDRAWKAAHPERAASAGGHGGEPRERRLADALVEVFDGAVVERDLVERDLVERDLVERDPVERDPVDLDSGEDAPDPGGAGASEPVRDERSPSASSESAPGPSWPAARSSQPSRPATYPTLPRRADKWAARTAVIITVDAHTMEAELLGSGPISNDELIDVLGAPRTDLYAAVRDMRGAILKFGRSRRLASPLQRLALAVRDRGCIWTGCPARWDRCDADHDPPWEHGGLTDLDQLRLLCADEHHPHRHETGANASRVDGEWRIDPQPQWQGS